MRQAGASLVLYNWPAPQHTLQPTNRIRTQTSFERACTLWCIVLASVLPPLIYITPASEQGPLPLCLYSFAVQCTPSRPAGAAALQLLCLLCTCTCLALPQNARCCLLLCVIKAKTLPWLASYKCFAEQKEPQLDGQGQSLTELPPLSHTAGAAPSPPAAVG